MKKFATTTTIPYVFHPNPNQFSACFPVHNNFQRLSSEVTKKIKN
jgi:hypothetical protein